MLKGSTRILDRGFTFRRENYRNSVGVLSCEMLLIQQLQPNKFESF